MAKICPFVHEYKKVVAMARQRSVNDKN